MFAHVQFQRSLLVECPRADLANERLLARVDPFMAQPLARFLESLLAVRTGVVVDASARVSRTMTGFHFAQLANLFVDGHVFAEVDHGLEGVAALFAVNGGSLDGQDGLWFVLFRRRNRMKRDGSAALVMDFPEMQRFTCQAVMNALNKFCMLSVHFEI